MKKIIYLLIIVLLAGLFFSCEDLFAPKQTKEECLGKFFNDMAALKYKQIHPDNSYYSQLKSSTVMSSIIPPTADYVITNKSGNTYTVAVDLFGTGISNNETYTFQEDGTDFWLIRSFTVDGTTYR